MDAVTEALAQSLAGLIPIAAAWAAAWFRTRIQKQVVEQATIEAENRGVREGMKGDHKKQLAVTLSQERLNVFMRPNAERLDAMVEQAVPIARASIRPPKND